MSGPYLCHSLFFSTSRIMSWMIMRRTCLEMSSMSQWWRWRGPQFRINPLQFRLLLSQLLLRLQAHPPHHNSHSSTSLSLIRIYWLVWMSSPHLLPLLHLSRLLRHHWPSGWPAPRSLSHRTRLFFFRYRATLVSHQLL